MSEDEYGVTERGEVRHIVWMEPRAWCGRILIWLYPNPNSVGCPQRICMRCKQSAEYHVRRQRASVEEAGGAVVRSAGVARVRKWLG